MIRMNEVILLYRQHNFRDDTACTQVARLCHYFLTHYESDLLPTNFFLAHTGPPHTISISFSSVVHLKMTILCFTLYLMLPFICLLRQIYLYNNSNSIDLLISKCIQFQISLPTGNLPRVSDCFFFKSEGNVNSNLRFQQSTPKASIVRFKRG